VEGLSVGFPWWLHSVRHAGSSSPIGTAPAKQNAVSRSFVPAQMTAAAVPRQLVLPGPRQLPGAEPMRGAAPLDPDQLEEVDLPLVSRTLEPGDLGGTELRGLMEHDAGGLVAVGAAVLGESVAEQLAGISFAQVGLRSDLEIFAMPPRTTTPSPRSLKTWATAVWSSSPSAIR
jgi:hypothetical protein